MKPLTQRIDEAIAEFHSLHPEFNVEITDHTVDRSDRGKGPGLSIYVETRCGVGFEVPLNLGEEHHHETPSQ